MDLLVSPINKGLPLTPRPSPELQRSRKYTGLLGLTNRENSRDARSRRASIAPTLRSFRPSRKTSRASSRRSLQTPIVTVTSENEDEGTLIVKPPPPAWYRPEWHLVAIKFVYLFVYANTACLIPYFVTYYIEWGLTPTELSLIQAAVPFFGFLVRPVIGRVADATNRHRAVFSACCIWCAFFHLPHMWIPKLPSIDSADACLSNCSASNLTNVNNSTSDSLISFNVFSNPDRLPTLTLLLGLRLVAYAGQAPTQDLADAFCYSAVDRDPRRWGRQRVWSTVGWASATFSVGYILHVLGSHYWLFAITAVFNILAAVSIIFLKPLTPDRPASSASSRSLISSSHSSSSSKRPKSSFSNGSSSSGVSFATSTNTMISLNPSLRLTTPQQASLSDLLKQTHVKFYLLFSMMSGSLLAVEFSFLLIFIKDSGGDELLIGMHQVVDSISEFPLFLFSGYILTWLGFVPCFCLSFATYVVRLICYSFLDDPLYLVLLVEIVHCFSFTLYVAAGTGYADSITAPGLEATLQSLFQGVFFGLGIGVGNLVGGFLYPVIGPRWLFRGSAVVAAICCLSYGAIYRSGILKTRKSSHVSKSSLTSSSGRVSTTVAFGGYSNSIRTIDGSSITADDDSKSISLLLPVPVPSSPIPTSELFLAADGLHRSPGSNRVPMVVMMTPLTRRILASDGVIRFIDE